ncbi:MAG TPA: YafY family protein [Azospirillaceae bacterium]|nr:YafY family protein [Azospirillaceae bacterium]
MRRADRLFQIIQVLRSGRLVTAAELAERLEVSERTVYRDMRDLIGSGVPVDGAAGAGYLLRPGFDLPPLMFTANELEALVLGARLVRAWAGGALAEAATAALDKIETAVPEGRRHALSAGRLYAPGFGFPVELHHRLDLVREATNARRVIAFDYVREDGGASTRTVHPLGLFFWGKTWTLVAWCELRDEFRHFRLDRMAEVQVLDRTFAETDGRTLSDYLGQYGAGL